MFWDIVLFLVLFTAGNFYGGIGIIVPMICVNFALPATRKLADKGWLTNASLVRKKYRTTIAFWGAINFVLFVVTFCFVPLKFSLGLWAGTLITALFGAAKTGANATNISEYLPAVMPYSRATTEDEIAEMIQIISKK